MTAWRTRESRMTSTVRNLAKAPLRERVCAGEWDARVNLAACYRLAAHFRICITSSAHAKRR